MTKETMTIHEALCELKTLDKRITAATNEAPWAVTNKHINQRISGVPIKDFVDSMEARFDKVNSLIRRRQAIKRAVVKSNASTEVVVNGETYTVAEAIEMKNHGVEFPVELARKMASDYSMAKMKADRANGDELDRRAEDHVRNTFGNTDMKGNAEEARSVRQQFIEEQTMDIVCIPDLQGVIGQINDWASGFLTSVDAALSVSNAVTKITFEY